MSLARLPHGQINELFVFLGPDSAELRRVCVLVRDGSNGLDLPFEILRWHCVNSALLDEKLHCLESLGRIPLRCSVCDARAKTRQMFRYNRNITDRHRKGMLYMCCLCVLDEARRFLKGAPNSLISQGGADCRDHLLVAILSRMRAPTTKLNLSMGEDTFEDRESYRAATAHAQAGDRSERRKRTRESADSKVKLKRKTRSQCTCCQCGT